MKYNYFFIGLLILLLCIIPVSAANETPVIEEVFMYIHGDATYVTGMPVPIGTVITAKDQFGKEIGRYVTREIGKYGSAYSSDRFELGVWRNQSDKANRTMPIRVTFTIGGYLAKTQLEFKQNEDISYNIISTGTENIQVSSTPTTKTSTTPVKTTATLVPSGVRTLPTAPISVSTTTQAVPITTALPIEVTQTTVQPQTIQTPTPTPIPIDPEETKQWIYYGIAGTIIIIMGILIAGIIYLYIMNKTSRDEVMQQDGKWKK
jgi:hypothetical protein